MIHLFRLICNLKAGLLATGSFLSVTLSVSLIFLLSNRKCWCRSVYVKVIYKFLLRNVTARRYKNLPEHILSVRENWTGELSGRSEDREESQYRGRWSLVTR